jgi:putative intracellular protease/amidase
MKKSFQDTNTNKQVMPLPHKSNFKPSPIDLKGYRALVITTSQKTLDRIDETTGEIIKVGKATGVYSSEMTEPYYLFLDAGMEVDLASIKGGEIPIEKLSLRPFVRTEYDNRFLKDEELKQKVQQSLPIDSVRVSHYDIIFMSGGWGAAYDFVQSDVLSEMISQAYAEHKILGSVCHGALGFIGAQKPDGSPLVEGVTMTGVTNTQLKQLMVKGTPKHPETELKNAGANYKSTKGILDMIANDVEVDKQHLIVTGQNQKAGVEAAYRAMELLHDQQSKK